MKVDNVELSETARLRMLIQEEAEGEMSPPMDLLMEEAEKLTPADLVQKMRQVKGLAPRWSEHTKASYAKSFEALSLQFCAAAAYLKRPMADDLPAYLREKGAA